MSSPSKLWATLNLGFPLVKEVGQQARRTKELKSTNTFQAKVIISPYLATGNAHQQRLFERRLAIDSLHVFVIT